MPILGTSEQIGYSGTRVVAMDPGSDTVGLATLEVRLGDPHIYVARTQYLQGKRFSSLESDLAQTYGDRPARIAWLSARFGDYLQQERPDAFIAEAPYMGKFATAFEALVEARVAFQRVLSHHDCLMYYNQIDPKSVKSVMGAADSSKPAMRDAVLRNPRLVWATNINQYCLSEHEYDAIAVGYWYITSRGL